ncbi:MAG: NUDIX domain-containing protein [Bacteroidales bacterium]|nr:NUDIX domain-containing protein [Bacteroidales bacterium]
MDPKEKINQQIQEKNLNLSQLSLSDGREVQDLELSKKDKSTLINMLHSRIRVTALLFHDNKVLLVRMHRPEKPDNDIFVLPGGGLELGEGIMECAVREVKEETHLDVDIEKIVYMKDLLTSDSHSLEVICLGRITGGTLDVGCDPEGSEEYLLQDVIWLEIDKLKDLNFHPQQLKEVLQKDLEEGFPTLRYLGKFEFPEPESK